MSYHNNPANKIKSRQRQRGQGLIEMALLMPIIIIIALVGFDMAHGFSYSISANGAARAGMRAAVNDPNIDIGKIIRQEASDTYPDTAATWGTLLNDPCNGVTCGDPQGCTVGSSFWANNPSALGCYAVRVCTSYDKGVCTGWDSGTGASVNQHDTAQGDQGSTWGTRPALGSTGKMVDVRVVFRYRPLFPLLSALVNNSNGIFLTNDAISLPLY